MAFQVSPTFGLPLRALFLVSTVCFLLSLIYIGSITAYNAIISLSALGLHISYVLPISFMLLRKVRSSASNTHAKPALGPFNLGRLGIPVNVVALCYLGFVIIWMPFPAVIPVTGNTMNYAGPLVGAVILGALGDYILRARRRFDVPEAHYDPSEF
jgi:choline transport protein